jgi:hypothetical protein
MLEIIFLSFGILTGFDAFEQECGLRFKDLSNS